MMRRDEEYWTQFWSEYKTNEADRDRQSQVLRTRYKQPIDKETWEITLRTVSQQMELRVDDTLLDLCCGNGLFTAAFSERVAHIDALDISVELTERLAAYNLGNVSVHTCDIRDVRYPAHSFSKVLWYAGIQYIDDSDIVKMIRRIHLWMKPGGTLLIGDIPDRSRLWHYFNDDTRCAAYFDGLEQRKPIIGTWVDANWLERLCLSSGFLEAAKVPQRQELIYADFRYDLIARK